MVKKSLRYVKPFSYNTNVSRTDDRQTDRHNCYINIARQSADARSIQMKYDEVLAAVLMRVRLLSYRTTQQHYTETDRLR